MNIVYNKYENLCREAVVSRSLFNNFRAHPSTTGMLEHVSYEQGEGYIREILKNGFPLFEYLDEFLENDLIGNPKTYWYEILGKSISPTTLRYIKVLSDLVRHFGDISDKRIVEVGGGYGGQCSIIHAYKKPSSYTIIDLPNVALLIGKYIRARDIAGVEILFPDSIRDDSYDLFLSNYAFAEIGRTHQNMYAQKVISKCASGYITCNLMENIRDGRMTKEEIKRLHPHGLVVDEAPLTYKGNFIYIWKKD